jgi:UDP-2,3-diacylglucosamine hydrolase
VLGQQLLVLSDAHLGITEPAVEEALLDFLDRAPELGDSLLVNGDLFDFWFSYSRVIPREGFAVAAALGALRRRMPVVMIGGNHDRWGEDFWRSDLNIEFAPLKSRFTVGRRQVLAIHGDGILEQHWSAKMMHRITRNRVTINTWRALHPDLGFWLVDRMSRVLGNTTRDEAVLALAADRQRDWASARLAEDPDLGAIIMGHTHKPALEEPTPGQIYLNPGAWMEGYRYGVLNDNGGALATFS